MTTTAGRIPYGVVPGEAAPGRIHEDDEVMALMPLHHTRSGEFVRIPNDHIGHSTDITAGRAAPV